MFKRILVPLDGSGRAEQALSLAARLARASAGSLILVRVVNTAPEHLPSVPAKPSLVQSVDQSDRLQAESYLEGVAASEQLKGIPVTTVVLTGLVASSILSAAASQQADVIALCSHGFTGMKRWVLGSVAEKIARYAEIPVLVLREDSALPTENREQLVHPQRVLVPLDGSDYAQAAIVPAAYLAAALSPSGNGELHLIYVIRTTANSTTGRADGELRLLRQGAVQYLEETANKASGRSTIPPISDLQLSFTSSVIASDDIAQALIRTAEAGEYTTGETADGSSRAYDAMAMTTYGQGGLYHWAMGSVTGRVLLGIHLPLLIVRPPSSERR